MCARVCNSTCFDIDRLARWTLNVTARSESGWLSGILLSRESSAASPVVAVIRPEGKFPGRDPPRTPDSPPSSSLSSDVCEWMLSSSSLSSSSKPPPAEGRELQMEGRPSRPPGVQSSSTDLHDGRIDPGRYRLSAPSLSFLMCLAGRPAIHVAERGTKTYTIRILSKISVEDLC